MNNSPKQAAILGAIAGALLLPVMQAAASYALWQVSMAVTKSALPSSVLSVITPWRLLLGAAPFGVPLGALLGALTGAALNARSSRGVASLRLVSRLACGVFLFQLALMFWFAWRLFVLISSPALSPGLMIVMMASTMLREIVTNVGFLWAVALAVAAHIAANRLRHEEKRAQQFAAPVDSFSS